jgi:two-component system osmolarity sensor histidine kinase EnvZ
MFMRNQVRSLRRLATAANAFGKGRDSPNFKPEGASEVRQAAAAFLLMRARIQRQITQRTEMLAGVSHDLRTPLTRMKLELALLADDENVEGLQSDVAEMEQMIEGYLSFARGEGNEAPQVTDLVALVTDAVTTARRDGSHIVLTAPEELHVPVRRDAMRRCLMNLLSNGARYGGEMEVTVTPAPGRIEILIDDDGPGIPPEEREAVFRPFYRIEGSRNMATGGVGLGLTIARDVMRSHGGDLTLDAAPLGGLRARLTLPR